MARLVVAGDAFSHILIETAHAHWNVFDLVSLTAAEGRPGPFPVLLGASEFDFPLVPSVAEPDAAEISRVLSATPEVPPPTNRLGLRELQGALSAELIRTRYQPIVRLSNRTPSSFEVLARLSHPVRGTLPPATFVPIIEDAGLGNELTDAVIVQALADAATALRASTDVCLSLNFPLDVLLLPETTMRLEDERHIAGLEPSRIVVELTERQPVESLTDLARAIERIRAIGYGVAIDDFGPALVDRLTSSAARSRSASARG
jgi:hypothetical protein